MRHLISPLLLLLFAFSLVHAELTSEQQQVPLEQEPANAVGAKIVLIAGEPSNKPGQHEYFAGCALMLDWLQTVSGVVPVMVAEGWTKNESVFDGARCVLLYMDGGDKHSFRDPVRWSKLKSLAKAGVGFVILHQGIDCTVARADDFRAMFGAAFLSDIGCRGHWDVEFTSIPTHPILSGVNPFSLKKDGWLYNLHFADQGVTHLLQSNMPDGSRKTDDAQAHRGRAETVAWSYERPGGGRSFGFTGCDLHANWAEANQRRLLLNGILWSAKLNVPKGGCVSSITPEQLAKNWDRKIFPPRSKKVSPMTREKILEKGVR